MTKRIFALIALASLLGGAKCQSGPVTPPSVGGSWGDWGSGGVATAGTAGGEVGGSPADSGDDCERAEAKASRLGCPLDAPRRATWAEACRNGRANGVDMQDDCVLIAKDCTAIHKCTNESAP